MIVMDTFADVSGGEVIHCHCTTLVYFWELPLPAQSAFVSHTSTSSFFTQLLSENVFKPKRISLLKRHLSIGHYGKCWYYLMTRSPLIPLHSQLAQFFFSRVISPR